MQLEDLIKKRDQLKSTVQRIQGRKEAAVKELADIEEDCKKRGVDPSQLDDAIQRLTEKYNTEVESLAEGVRKAEDAIKPFIDGV